MNAKKIQGHLIAAFTIVVWGSTFIASKFLLEAFSPVQIMTVRFGLAYLLLKIFRPKFEKVTLRRELLFLAMGLTGNSLYLYCENTALTYTHAANVSIILACTPVITSLLAHFFTKDQKLYKNVFLGFLLAFLGVALVVFNGTVVLKLNPLGDILALCACLCWAVYSVIQQNLREDGVDSISMVKKVMFYGFVTSLPLFLAKGLPIDFAAFASPKLLVSMLFLAVMGSCICYVTWNLSIRTLGVIITNNYIYAIPFITMIMASLFLAEPISWMGVLGAILIIGGVVVSAKKPRAAEAEALAPSGAKEERKVF